MKLNKEDSLITIRVPIEVKEKLDALSALLWSSTSDVVRSGIRRELDAHKDLLTENSNA